MEALYHVHDLNLRDVCIVPCKEDSKYYLFDCFRRTDQEKRAINVRESNDLIWWTQSYTAFEPDEEYWGPYDLWAPECHYWKGKYYAVSSFREKGGYRGCEFLVANTPKGPFVPIKGKPVTPENWHSLDGTLYEDLEGNPWMIFCHEWIQVQDGQICAIRMKSDLSDSIGEPIILFRASEAPWKFTDTEKPWKFTQSQPKMGWARVTDGPYAYRADNGELLMIWSGFSDTGYTTGCARSVSGEIQGPWIQDKEPIYSQDGGHGMLFRKFDGKLMLAMHSPNIVGEERMLLFEMEDRDGKLLIINEITGNWIPQKYNPDGTDKSPYADGQEWRF